MGSKPIWGIIFLALLNSGCSCFYTYAVENLTHYPLHKVDDFAEHQRNHVLACAAWREIEAACPDKPSSHDYMHGFHKGYADFLYYGGKGDPPFFPPWDYQTIHTQSPEGYLKAEAWFAGWRQGVDVAKASGRRDFMPIPASLRFPPELLRMSVADRTNFLTAKARTMFGPAAKETPTEETLPLPKVLPPEKTPDEPAKSPDEPAPGFAAERPGEPLLIPTSAATVLPPAAAPPFADDRRQLRPLPPPTRRGLLNNPTFPTVDVQERGILNRRRVSESPVRP